MIELSTLSTIRSTPSPNPSLPYGPEAAALALACRGARSRGGRKSYRELPLAFRRARVDLEKWGVPNCRDGEF
jgi:hypothetical protein